MLSNMQLVFALVPFLTIVYSDMIDIRIPENCTTNTGLPGTCKFLDECPSAIDAFANPKKEEIQHLSSLLCQSFIPNVVSVCCSNPSLKTLPEVSDQRYCGFQHFDDLMIDLRQTSIIEFPWIAALMRKTKNDVAEIACLGAMINSRYVVTSGYCAKIYQDANYPVWVRLGEFYLQNTTDCVTWSNIQETECNQFTDYEVEEAVVHPFLSHVIVSMNDIGLLRLKKKIDYSDYVRPICLPTEDKDLSRNVDYYTSGWVDDQFKIKIPSTVVNRHCHLSNDSVLHKYNQCIKYQIINDAKISSCSILNNGAPIMFSSKNQWHLKGVSYLYFKQNNDCIARYTPIVPYMNWIRDNVRE